MRLGGWFVLLGLLTSGNSGCGRCDTGGQDAIAYRGGRTNGAHTYYETAGVHDEWLHFPAGRVYSLIHDLRGEPLSFQSYLNFEPRLTEETNFAESAGNQVVYEAVDENVIQVRNDTCAEFYLRVVATTQPDGLSPVGGDATSAGGAAGSGS